MQKLFSKHTLIIDTQKKTLFFSLLMFLFFGNVSKSIAGDVVINEFYSNGSGDWIELYNTSDSVTVDLSSYRIRDASATNKIDLTGSINPHGFSTFDWGNNLNNGGDSIKLVSKDNESAIIDQVACGDAGNDVGAPGVNQSAGRSPDGTGSFVIFSSLTKGSSNASSSVAPPLTPTPELQAADPSPTRTPTPSKTPTPTKIPTPTRSPTPIKTPTTTKTPIPTIKSTTSKLISAANVTERDITALPNVTKVYPTAVLGASSSATTPTRTPSTAVLGEQTKKSGANPLLFALPIIGVGLIGGGIFYYIKKQRNDEV